MVRAALNSQTLQTVLKHLNKPPKKFVQQIQTRGDGTQRGFNLSLPVEGARVSARHPLLPVCLTGAAMHQTVPPLQDVAAAAGMDVQTPAPRLCPCMTALLQPLTAQEAPSRVFWGGCRGGQ